MGVQVELPTLRKKRLMSSGLIETTPTRKGANKEMDHESWQWGAFENLSIENHMSQPTRLSENCGADVATLADSPDGSFKHLISPSRTDSSPESPFSPLSTISPSFRGGMCVDPFGGGAKVSAYHRRLKKEKKEKKGDGCKGPSSMSYDCRGEFRPSRWDSGRWSGGTYSFDDGVTPANRPRGKVVCKCAAGLTADVAVVCCCPFAVLHLLAIAFVKVPAAVMIRTMRNIKVKFSEKRQRATVHEEDDEMNTPASSCPPSRSRSYEDRDLQTWAPALAFGDQKLWRDYFDSPDALGDFGSGEPLRAKS